MIYLDYAAAAPVRKEVEKVVKDAEKCFANPSSLHDFGKKAKELLENSREKIKKIMNANERDKIIFTSSGTESINLALKGLARANKNKGKHIITSKIEHEAVLETCQYLEKEEGFTVTYLDVDRYGLVNPSSVERAITPETILITVMYANNEVGTIQEISKIGKIARRYGLNFHSDACQAGSLLDLNVNHLNVDLMTLNGSKIYGPQGIGMLYLREGVKIQPLIHGGKQEQGWRSGTENVPAICGFAKAVELAQQEKEKERERLFKLQQKLVNGIIKKIPYSSLNGHPKMRLPNNVNITFSGLDAEQIVRHLNEEGIYVSSGSACASRSMKLSHVLEAMNLPAASAVRFTLGKGTKEEDINKVLEIIPPIIQSLREAENR